MRKILAAFLILVSLLSYSQAKNPFSEAENNAEQSSTNDRISDTEKNSYNNSNTNSPEYAPADSGCTVIINGVPKPDCNCNGIPDDMDPDECTPNPGDPVPIDGYIPLLLLTAVGFIIYQTRKEKKLS